MREKERERGGGEERGYGEEEEVQNKQMMENRKPKVKVRIKKKENKANVRKVKQNMYLCKSFAIDWMST